MTNNPANTAVKPEEIVKQLESIRQIEASLGKTTSELQELLDVIDAKIPMNAANWQKLIERYLSDLYPGLNKLGIHLTDMDKNTFLQTCSTASDINDARIQLEKLSIKLPNNTPDLVVATYKIIADAQARELKQQIGSVETLIKQITNIINAGNSNTEKFKEEIKNSLNEVTRKCTALKESVEKIGLIPEDYLKKVVLESTKPKPPTPAPAPSKT